MFITLNRSRSDQLTVLTGFLQFHQRRRRHRRRVNQRSVLKNLINFLFKFYILDKGCVKVF